MCGRDSLHDTRPFWQFEDNIAILWSSDTRTKSINGTVPLWLSLSKCQSSFARFTAIVLIIIYSECFMVWNDIWYTVSVRHC